jgi:fatty acid desaturase
MSALAPTADTNTAQPPPRSTQTPLYAPYRANLLSIQRVRQLSLLRPGRVIRDTALCWVCIVAAWTMVALWPAWWTAALAFVIVGTRYYGLFIIGHDGLHRRLFDNKRDNDRFNDLFVLGPIGAITRLNNKNHLQHHLSLGTDHDPDRHKYGCFNKSEFSEMMGFLTGITSLWASVKNVFFRRGTQAKQKRGYTLRDVAILGAWQLGLIGGLWLSIGWWAYPVLWLMPVYTLTFLADNLRSFCEHSHPQADHEADEHRLITYVSNPIERMFLAPMNMNRHAAHHLWPSIPYYNLPQADDEIRAMPQDLEWRKSYVGYLWRYYRALPLEECKAAAPARL